MDEANMERPNSPTRLRPHLRRNRHGCPTQRAHLRSPGWTGCRPQTGTGRMGAHAVNGLWQGLSPPEWLTASGAAWHRHCTQCARRRPCAKSLICLKKLSARAALRFGFPSTPTTVHSEFRTSQGDDQPTQPARAPPQVAARGALAHFLPRTCLRFPSLPPPYSTPAKEKPAPRGRL